MKRATKDFMVVFVLGIILALGIATVVYEASTYFVDMAGSLTPYAIYSWGFGMIVGSSIGIAIIMEKRRKRRKYTK